MKKTLINTIFIMFFVVRALPVWAGTIDISGGTYFDTYNSDQWMTDCYSYAGGVTRNVGGYMVLQSSGGTPGTLTYKFTRTNASLPVIVQFDVKDASLGNFLFGASLTTTFTYQTLSNWLGSAAPNAWLTVKVQIAAGITTFYFSFQSQQVKGGAYLDNLTVGTDLSAYYTYSMSGSGFSLLESFNSDNWKSFNYQIEGTAVRNATNNSMSLRADGDEISYRFQTVAGYVINSLSLSCTAQCIPNTLNITFKTLSGSTIYSQNITANGAASFSTATNLASVANQDGVEVVFTAVGGGVSFGTLNVTAQLTPGISIGSGDLNRDGVVDWADLYIFCQNWLETPTNMNFVDYSILAANWFQGYHWAGYVSNLTALTNLGDASEGDMVWVGDRKGFFFYKATALGTADNVFFVNSNVLGGQWIRQEVSGEPVNVRWFGAVGDGSTDDSAAVQAAVNYARTNNLPVYLPSGVYLCDSPINFAQWVGIKLRGAGSGLTQLIGNSLSGVCFDFSGSSYGTISGISFEWANVKPIVCVLLDRGSAGYGSDLVFDDCFFGSGSVACVYSFSSEVLTFNNCRFECKGLRQNKCCNLGTLCIYFRHDE